MKTINKTKYVTQDVSAIVRRALRGVLKPAQMRRLILNIVIGRGKRTDGVWGWANYHCDEINISLTRNMASQSAIAATAVHEAWHAKGVRHGDMPDAILYSRTHDKDGRSRYPWASTMPLRMKEEVNKKRPGVAEKIAHANEKVHEWERKAQLATNRAKAWKRKARGIELRHRRAAKREENP